MKNDASPFNLAGRTALITGSTQGIGFAMAEVLAMAGANIVLNGTSSPESAQPSVDTLKQSGREVWYCQSDLSKPGSAHVLFKEAVLYAGHIDILISNASVQNFNSFLDVTEEEMDYQFATNFKSSFILIQCATAAMLKKGWGRIVTIGSVQEENHNPDFSVYGALKAAQTHFIKGLARAYSKNGITFNNIAPGFIDTKRNTDFLADPENVAKMLAKIPADRVGVPEDCGGAALLLCSDASSYITGTNLFIDGGLRLKPDPNQ